MKPEYASPTSYDCKHGVNLDDDCKNCLKNKINLIKLLAEKGLSGRCRDKNYILSRIYDTAL